MSEMASKGNQTCVQLLNVAKTGLPHHTTSLIIKGTWYPQHFALALTDGVSAWRIDATESFVIQRATDLKLTAAQFVDTAHLHLGHKKASSLYSLHSTTTGVHLLCTPRDGRDLLTDSTINLPLITAPPLELTFEMLQFLMLAYQDLMDKSERKARTFERRKGDYEQSFEELQRQNSLLQYEKTQLELKVLSIKDTEQLAIVAVPSSSGLKRKLEPGGCGGGEEVKKKKRGRPPGKSRTPGQKEGELSGCDGEWKKNGAKPGKKRGRKPKCVVVQAQEQTLPLVRPFGGPQNTTSLTRNVLSEHRIEEQSERAIKLLEPYTRQLAKPQAAPAAAAAAADLKVPPLPRQPSEDTSTQSSVALPLLQPQPKEFNVINADFYDFDNERSKYVMGLGQYWALYDNHDGMPRFYGRIVSLTLEPFAVDVEWLEPQRPAAQLTSLHLSVSCGEFKRDSISAQTLAAFSHRVEVEVADARKQTYRIFPKKGDVWAVYKLPLVNHPLRYELVEILTDVCKERGVKVGPVTKVPGFKTVFRSGGNSPPRWIGIKDLHALFSHQIATHRFDGSETRVVPRGSFGLDSASTPEEFLSSSVSSRPAVEVMQTISESG